MPLRESSKARRLRRCISVGSDIWISLAWLVGILVVGYAFATASVARSAEAELCSRQGPSARNDSACFPRGEAGGVVIIRIPS